ncbi:glycoside hydrolase family 43 protein [Bifidobacterium sp. IMAU50988]|uniref:Glycoside hydrolase family 43 protein n=2 Tax=Bifidobacterium favimelis TaxID=3122979 RepID=A0ABU8ZPH9_9BIFI
MLLTGSLAACGQGGGGSAQTHQEPKRVSVHDPSVVRSGKDYYVFGSHRAYAKSTDLVNWTPFTNNLSRDYEKIFADIWKDWPKQSSNPDVKGNMWAPDVYYNKTMKKWCMYLSLNGAEHRSVIVLLTADRVDGDWTYVGPVIYSGFTRANYMSTDIPKVLGDDPGLDRYQSYTDTGINAIDACVKDDGQGGLWMSFGSWFGGVWMIRLDPATGLRDYRTTYETKPNVSDAYYGHKIAGGFGNSGEGSALLHTNGHWYLFLSYGKLVQTGGYQMRMFRADKITGPYLDQAGNPAISTSTAADNWTDKTGIRLMASYQWSGDRKGDIEVSQGGNTALHDEDGTDYVVYHTRFSDRKEEHQIRVRQLIPTSDGWLVAAPYEYLGTKAGGAYTAKDEAGAYELITHDPTTFFKGPRKVTDQHSTNYRGVNKAVDIELKADGTVDGGRKGTWKAGRDGQVTITLEGGDYPATYQGVFARLPRDKDGRKVMTFSALGGNVCIWGSKA